MLVGSVTIMRSMPVFCIARRVFAMRASYSLRSNGRRTVGTLAFGLSCCVVSDIVPSSERHVVGENGACASGLRPRYRKRGDRRVLCAGAGEIADGDVRIARAARCLSGNDFAEFGECLVGFYNARLDRVMQFAEHARLLDAVADVMRR